MKALTEEAEKPGIESEKTDLASVAKNTRKKKVIIVKKIVKRKVIRKVPKRVSVASDCNDLEQVSSPKPNDNSPMVETEKPNVVVKELREIEDMKEIEVIDREKDICLVENSDCSRDESERSGLVINMDVEEHAGVDTVKEDGERSEDTKVDGVDTVKDTKVDDGERSEDTKVDGVDTVKDTVKEDVERREDTKVDECVKEHDEMSECDGAKLEGGLSNGFRGEDGMEEQVEKREDIDLKLSDAVEGQEVVNSESDGLKLQEGSSEIQVASRLHMKSRMKIFIHGLDKETKEEDVRKVFEEVGEVVEVKLIRNYRSGKSRGCGHIRYASADLARLARKKYNNVEICGKLCHTEAVDGSDTILLNNINKNWNNEHVLNLLQKIGIKNISEVLVVSDPENPKLNRGFAYLELETKRDAQIVYGKLQNKNIFGTHSNIKVTWAGPLPDPVEEEIHNINNNNNNNYNNYNNNLRSVYAENIPSTWDEKGVKDHFKGFGEIESIALAKNLWSTNRNDFAFINYKTCESALSCFEALTCKKSIDDNGVKVSLTKSIPKVKPITTAISRSTVTEDKQKTYLRPHKPQNMKSSSISRHENGREKGESSTTDELVRLLREQASWKHGGPSLTPGMNTGHHHQPPFGGKQPLTQQLGSKLLYHDPQAYHQTHHQIRNAPHPSPTANGVALPSFSHADPQHAHYTSTGSFNVVEANPRYFQSRDQVSYHGSSSSSSIYRRMH